MDNTTCHVKVLSLISNQNKVEKSGVWVFEYMRVCAYVYILVLLYHMQLSKVSHILSFTLMHLVFFEDNTNIYQCSNHMWSRWNLT